MDEATKKDEATLRYASTANTYKVRDLPRVRREASYFGCGIRALPGRELHAVR